MTGNIFEYGGRRFLTPEDAEIENTAIALQSYANDLIETHGGVNNIPRLTLDDVDRIVTETAQRRSIDNLFKPEDN